MIAVLRVQMEGRLLCGAFEDVAKNLSCTVLLVSDDAVIIRFLATALRLSQECIAICLLYSHGSGEGRLPQQHLWLDRSGVCV